MMDASANAFVVFLCFVVVVASFGHVVIFVSLLIGAAVFKRLKDASVKGTLVVMVSFLTSRFILCAPIFKIYLN